MLSLRLMMIVTSIYWLSGCARPALDAAQMQQVAGHCQAGAATDTPPRLYTLMVDCIQQQDYAQATQLYALAGSYSRYDALRTETPLARHQHSQMLSQALQQLEPEQLDSFWQLLRPTLEDRSALAFTCKYVRDMGPPVYQRNYLNDPAWSLKK